MDHKTVVFNEAKMNFDGNLNFSVLSPEVVTYSDTTPDQFLERAADAEILVTKEMPVSREQILALPDSVKLICEAGTGYNNLDLDAAREKGITVCNIPAYSSERVAHTAIMMILNLSSTMQTQMAMLAKGNHDNFTKNLQVPHVEVNGKTLGIIGAGNIGRTVMKIAKALDMNILVYTRTPKDDEENVQYADLETVLKNSDYISLHVPLLDSTRDMISTKEFEMMKDDACLINAARGGIVNEEALYVALSEHKIRSACFDVYSSEPPKADDKLVALDNFLLTPHTAARCKESERRTCEMSSDIVMKQLLG